MVPCYSESEYSLRITLDSVDKSIYPASHKTILVVADGLVRGGGNDKYTHEYCLEMMLFDSRFDSENPQKGNSPPSHSYVALADGNKRKNFAQVYVGWYKRENGDTENMTPMIVVVKVGNNEEKKSGKKPGNRGKVFACLYNSI
jgi:chitin synthase